VREHRKGKGKKNERGRQPEVNNGRDEISFFSKTNEQLIQRVVAEKASKA